MKDQREEIANNSGIIWFIVLFFLLIFPVSQKPNNQSFDASQSNVNFEIFLVSANAVIADAFQLITFQSSCLNIIHNATLNLFNKTYKIFADNRKIDQQIILLQKTELKIKPIFPFRICFHLVPTDKEELPILS
jgi:hypothetical protein